MKTEVRNMLNKMYGIFIEKFRDSTFAWDRFIEFLAIDNNGFYSLQLDHNLEWLFEDSQFRKKVINAYDRQLLKSDYYDNLGDIYFDIFLSNRGQRGSDQELNKIKEHAKQPGEKAEGEKLKILDRAAQTGRFLMISNIKYPNSFLFGVEPDLRLYRIALTNFAIFDISGYLLNANCKTHEISLKSESGLYNWRFANIWNPPIEKLKRAKSSKNN